METNCNPPNPAKPGLIKRSVCWLFTWQTVRRVVMGIAVLVTLTAIFYAEENWRGKRAWENCKRELEAKGETLDWNAYVPRPVPDDQNFFKAPKMAEWFVRNRQLSTNELTERLRNADTTTTITNETAAANYLARSDSLKPDFDLIREGLKRPYAQIDGDYSRPYEMPIPNFVAMRLLAQVLAQRTKCYLLLGQPEKALMELTLLNDSRRILEGAPTGKPMTLVAAMINVAIVGVYVETLVNGLQKHAWQEPQWVKVQKQLEQIHLPPLVVLSFECAPAATTHTLETVSTAKLKEWFQVSDGKSSGGKMSLWQNIRNLKWTLIPRGWIYQNMATSARLVHQQTEGCDAVNGVIQPQKFGDLTRELNAIARPYKFFAAAAIPNFTKAWQTTAYNQTLVNEAQITCALERYRLAHGEYPETLDALVPQFIAKLPHDIIGGQPLYYRRTDGGKFLLYSVGWNETDDGGQVSEDRTKSDWVWKN